MPDDTRSPTATPAPTPAPASHGPYTFRVLAPEERVTRARDLLHYVTLPDPERSILAVVEDAAGQIVATWTAIELVHLEGLYIDPGSRGNPVVAKLLADGMLDHLRQVGLPAVLTHTPDPAILALARKRDFVIVPGTLLQKTLTPGPDA